MAKTKHDGIDVEVIQSLRICNILRIPYKDFTEINWNSKKVPMKFETGNNIRID